MKRVLRFVGMMLLLLPVPVWSADFALDSATYFRFQQSAVPGFDKKLQVPATQYLTIDATRIAVEGLSLHFSGWGGANLGDRISDESRTDGYLNYFYLSYRLPVANALIKAGRHSVMAGTALEQIDGISARTDLPLGFTAALYGGAPSRLDYGTDNTGQTIVGGRVSSRIGGILELGVGALREGGLNALVTTGSDTATVTGRHRERQLIGGDIWLSPLPVVELSGQSYYNTTTSGIAEHAYLVKVTPVAMLTASGDFSEQNPKDYFTTTNLPSLFKPTETDRFRKYGLQVTFRPVQMFELNADYHRYNRDAKGNSNRYGIDLRGTFLDRQLRTGLSYHRVEGPTVVATVSGATATRYDEVRGYALYDARLYLVSIDAITQLYNEKINDRKAAYELLLSAGYRFVPKLLLSGDVSYGRNPDLNSEVKGLVKLVYHFTTEEKGARK
jgi:hypothetical protein